MSVFFSTREFTVERKLAVSYDTLLGYICKPEQVISSGPLFSSVAAEGDGWYTVEENLTILGFETKSKFCCHFDATANGYKVQVYADLATRLNGHLRLTTVEGDPNSVLFQETVVVRVRD